MRHRLRVLLAGSAIALAVSVVTMAAYALSTGSSSPGSRRAIAPAEAAAGGSLRTIATGPTSPYSDRVTGTDVCGMLTPGEVYQLLNTEPAAIEIGTPAPVVSGGACAWGTGQGEAFELKVVGRPAGSLTRPCAGIQGTEVRSNGWIGCSRLSFLGDNVFRAVKGSYVVAIEPDVNVIGSPYLMAEESTITHVFRELGE